VFRSSCLSIYPYLDTAKRHCMHGSSNPHQASRASFMFFQNTQYLSDHFYMYVYRYLSITLLSLCHSLSLIVSLTLSICLSLCLFVSFSLSHTQHLTHSPSISIFISLYLSQRTAGEHGTTIVDCFQAAVQLITLYSSSPPTSSSCGAVTSAVGHNKQPSVQSRQQVRHNSIYAHFQLSMLVFPYSSLFFFTCA
jgi:hypothetical protein